MAYALYGREVFRAEVDGRQFTFTCYGQGTSYGFRHICCEGFSNTTTAKYVRDDIIAKATYYNRTYESFKYETVLKKAIQSLNETKEIKDKLYSILIEKRNEEEHEKCEKDLQAFKSLYDQTSPEFKERIANSDIVLNSESDVRAVKGLMLLDILLKS